ncbi:hypothetical protein AWC38_SpisGene10818 [Stylophora pistillata]|uniref:Uncharacterized protein n=1 Tax=Stylophora pistillata TaxID=50429 RepID=A0A2B4S1J5_STYPI|nr:hypothetical protein AWC38_SpisGene10818 [Stylophora pistillata]
MPFLRSAHTGAHFIKMNSSPRKVAINKGYDGDDPTMQKPVHLKEIRNNSKEDDGQVGAEVDSPNTIYETLEGGSNGVKRPNWRYMGLVIIACLISVVALFLSLLMVSEKGSRKCDCSRNEALSDAGNMRAFVENIKSLTNDSDNKIKALEENIKNLITNDDKKIRALEDNTKNLTTEADKIRILEENITILQRKLAEKSMEINSNRLSLGDVIGVCAKNTFHYDSAIWSNMTELNTSAGMTGFDEQESKLPTYWSTNFNKICLGMKKNNDINFILINKTAESLFSLIADGEYRITSLGRNTWKSLLGSEASLQPYCNREGFNAHTPSSDHPKTAESLFSLIADGEYRITSLGRNTWKSLLGSEASLQPYCNREGFNAHTPSSDHPKVRIGILGNEQNDCDSCDSRLGFGGGGRHDDSNTCGNAAGWGGDNGDKNIKAMGYIFVQ